jgi:type I restriction enzyme S subunit
MSETFKRVRLGEIAYFEMGNSPRSKYVDETPPGVPFLQGNAEFGAKVPNHDRYCVRPSKVSQQGDILISVRAPVGDVNVSDRRYCIGRGLAAVRFHDLADGFGWHLMKYAAPKLDKYAQGSTFRAVNKAHLENLEVVIPGSRKEQRRIADVLDTVDAAIQETDAVVDKQEQVKRGLLQDLLTRGLDANGRLRDPEREPEAFEQNEELGTVPADWETTTLGEVVARSGGTIQTGPFGSQLHKEEYVEDGVPVVMPQNINDGCIQTNGVARITPEKAHELRRHELQPGDVLIARRGDLQRCAAVTKREAGWICGTGCLLVRPPSSEISGALLSLMYRQPACQRQVEAQAVGSTMLNLNQDVLKSLQISLPSRSEQGQIEGVVADHSSHLDAERKYQQKLQSLKTGLMQDLLTGRVRVPEAEDRVDEVTA